MQLHRESTGLYSRSDGLTFVSGLLPEKGVMAPEGIEQGDAMFVAIGKGTEDAWPRPGQLSLNEVVIKNMFD